MTTWCQSGRVPIQAGWYRYDSDGEFVLVRQSKSGRFYAVDHEGHYVRGLIYDVRRAMDRAEMRFVGQRT